MIYLEFKTFDNYTSRIMKKTYTTVPYDLDPDNVREAFDFMVSFEKADKFTQSSLKVGKKEALNVLNIFEDKCASIIEAEDVKRQKKRENEAEARRNAPILWEDEIAPAFTNLSATLEEFKNIPGYQTHLFSDALNKEFRNIKDMLGIVDKRF